MERPLAVRTAPAPPSREEISRENEHMRDVLQRLRSELGGLLAGTAAQGSVGTDQLVAFIRAATDSIGIICNSTTHQTGVLEPRASVISPSAAAAVAAVPDVPGVDTPAKFLPVLGVGQAVPDTLGPPQQQHMQAGAYFLCGAIDVTARRSGLAAPPLRMIVNNAMQSMQYVVPAREGHGATPVDARAGSALLSTDTAHHLQQAPMFVQTAQGVLVIPAGWGAHASPNTQMVCVATSGYKAYDGVATGTRPAGAAARPTGGMWRIACALRVSNSLSSQGIANPAQLNLLNLSFLNHDSSGGAPHQPGLPPP